MEATGTKKSHYPIGIISDTHLGIANPCIDYLVEFLNHASFDKLILNGDIIDGRYINKHRKTELNESEKRVLDAINAKIAEGTEVVYIPGNHDIEMRSMDLFGKKWHGMLVENTLDITDPKGRKLHVAHGDAFDVYEQREGGRHSSFINKIVFRFYNRLSKISAYLDKACEKIFDCRVAIAPRAKNIFERLTDMLSSYKDELSRFVLEKGYDGIVCGHFHVPEKENWKKGELYLNTGDWTENYTAIVLDSATNDWQLIKWLDKRRALGLKTFFKPASQKNVNEAFRLQTESMIKTLAKIWPGKK